MSGGGEGTRDDGDAAPADAGRFEPSDGVEPDGERVAGWPVALDGVLEAVAATRGPNDRWNHAALGIEPAAEAAPTAPAEHPEAEDAALATARTWGRTRTRRNLAERGEAYVQFTRDPVDVVEAALDVYETDDPILGSADAWVHVDAEEIGRRDDDGTEVVEWVLEPVEAAVRQRVVPAANRGRAAVLEATVAASRLDVGAYDESVLTERLGRLGEVVERCGSERDRAAFERIEELTGWRRGERRRQ